jgi:hypothetical protein
MVALLLLVLTTLLLTTLLLTTLLLVTAMLTVLSIAWPSLSVESWASRTVMSGTVLLSSSPRRTSTGMVTLRVILEAALLRVQILALRPQVTILARSCVQQADRH